MAITIAKRVSPKISERHGLAAKMPESACMDYWDVLKGCRFENAKAFFLCMLHWVPDNSSRLARVQVLEGERLHLEAFEPLLIDLPPTGIYDLVAVPDWVRARIAALSIMPIPPPPQQVEAVGLRISETVFWVIQ